MKDNNSKLHLFQPLTERPIPISWEDIEPTGQTEKIFRLKKDGTLGIKLHKSELDEERRRSGNALVEWLSEGGVPAEHKSGLDALIEAWNS